ncbi:hypothetical protein RRG08_038026 [Elysia crispata]|uniref:Uncharacterized protein n=1 Tax=Elysia crispata TaxID=231223 RepID=A0AAE0ZZH2_9GAST|nr:hypothetical protein RRG08_038026 [Elysia crispata]
MCGETEAQRQDSLEMTGLAALDLFVASTAVHRSSPIFANCVMDLNRFHQDDASRPYERSRSRSCRCSHLTADTFRYLQGWQEINKLRGSDL